MDGFWVIEEVCGAVWLWLFVDLRVWRCWSCNEGIDGIVCLLVGAAVDKASGIDEMLLTKSE